ncbi:MAG TPA: hypothetical protein VGN13_10800 [Solirubrobacteraceae bacterium]|jgi:hypothetical protein
MAGKPAEPRRDERARPRRLDADTAARPRAGGDARGGEREPAERTGPLRIERLRKADGRALILYAEDSAVQARS